jgi:YggT family protein
MDIVVRIVYSGITLYMIAILLVWLSAWIGIETEYGKAKILKKMTEPLLEAVRKAIPPMGPFDMSPIVALFGLWFIRVLSVRILTDIALGV